ncbi:XdhC family protein [Veillonella criceti]|uniref:Xanthine dehydrogenase accessory protein XdhC n=1 Tax=Veillonella criceti TaxID=103891 RepID=A0A380NLT3_9FIRM|nr:XdhC family protein [Veillonella criceti]SUP43483.1 xanthine dehydrogenase accessory protein XdhC [Veillonella criceti]
MKREFVRYLQGRETDTLAVATILQTKGSTPRKAGTTMVVHPDGSIFGTIGGGRAENEIRLNALEALQKKEAHRRILVDLNDDVAVKEGMVCGGNLDVWIETQNV